MEKVILKAEKRDVIGKQVKAMRRAGKLPAVIYGRHTDPINVSLDAHSARARIDRISVRSSIRPFASAASRGPSSTSSASR